MIEPVLTICYDKTNFHIRNLFINNHPFFPQQSNAQYFAPIGAKWTYTLPVGFYSSPPCPCHVEPFTIEVMKDTIINGLNCREAVITISGAVQDKKYIRSINDSVLVYSPVNNQFNLLYDFTANVGDTIQIYSEEMWSTGFLDSSLVHIDSVGVRNINGVNYRAYHQTCLSAISDCFEGGMLGWVIDSLGVMEPYYDLPNVDVISYLFLPPLTGGPPNIYPLRCYSDSNTYYNYDGSACDTTYVVTSINDISRHDFEISPTLLTNNEKLITLKTNNSILPKQIQLFNLTGIAIDLQIKKQNNATHIMLDQKIPSGIYLLRFTLDKEIFTRKIVVL